MSQDSYYENGVYYYKGLLDDLDKLTVYEPFKNLINPPLDDRQSVDLLRALAVKHYALFYETGLGKTFLATAYVKALLNKNINSKILMFIKKSQDEETPKKVSSISGIKTAVITAKKSTSLNSTLIENNDIIMMTHDTLTSERHMIDLNFYKDKFSCIIVDEAHCLSNIECSTGAFMLLSLIKNIEYSLILTATPVTTDIEQFVRVLKITSPNDIDNFRKIGGEIKRYGLSALPKKYLDLFTIRQRENTKHIGIPVFIEPMKHQINAKGKDMFIITKGDGATNQINSLIKEIKDRKNKRGVVYVWRRDIQDFVVKELKENGIKCELINGKTTSKNRTEILENYRNDTIQVIVTNIKEALDMDGDYVIFYELSVLIKQILGRVERGLTPKPIEILFMFTLCTGEFDYFERNIFDISQQIQEIFGIDCKEVYDVKNQQYLMIKKERFL